LIGLAVGDALGATLEFGPRRGKTNLHTEMIGGGPFRLKPGQYTDDTAMALALASAIVAGHAQFKPFEVAMNFLGWYTRGRFSSNGRCFDIGNTTRRSLERFLKTKETIAPRDESALGNGAIMRLAPVPIAYSMHPEKAAEVADVQTRITHNASLNIAAAQWLAFRLALQIRATENLFDGTDRHCAIGADYLDDFPALLECVGTDWRAVPRTQVSSGGHVIDTLGAALWSIQTTGNFEDAVVAAVNLGDDADTVGAVTGMIAGAIYGEAAIPARWKGALAYADKIKATAVALDGMAA